MKKKFNPFWFALPVILIGLTAMILIGLAAGRNTEKGGTSGALSSELSYKSSTFCNAPTLPDQYVSTDPEAEVQTVEEVAAADAGTSLAETYAADDPAYIQEEETEAVAAGPYTADDIRYAGVIYWDGWRWTWYSEYVLPGDGLDIPGRWSDGNFVRDGEGYICLASSDLPKGSILMTPFGEYGKVYDCGCNPGTMDVYTSFN